MVAKSKSTIKPEILAISERGNVYETIHYGWICVLNKKQRIFFKKGNTNNLGFLRSVAKPIQALPLLKTESKVSIKELAVICSSHSGSKMHLKILEGLIKRFSLKESDLQCGIHIPTDPVEKVHLLRKHLSPNVLHNNCSGKHIGMLITCIANKWSKKTYLHKEHPLQQNIKNIIKYLSQAKIIYSGADGCSAPTFAIPIKNIAVLFSNFTNSSEQTYNQIIQAMTNYPYYAGSKDQLDSEIMKVSKGRILSKVGGGGIIVAAKDGESIVVKIADGTQYIRALVTIKLLLKLKWLNKKNIKNTILEEYASGNLKNHSQKIIGKAKVIF